MLGRYYPVKADHNQGAERENLFRPGWQVAAGLLPMALLHPECLPAGLGGLSHLRQLEQGVQQTLADQELARTLSRLSGEIQSASRLLATATSEQEREHQGRLLTLKGQQLQQVLAQLGRGQGSTSPRSAQPEHHRQSGSAGLAGGRATDPDGAGRGAAGPSGGGSRADCRAGAQPDGERRNRDGGGIGLTLSTARGAGEPGRWTACWSRISTGWSR